MECDGGDGCDGVYSRLSKTEKRLSRKRSIVKVPSRRHKGNRKMIYDLDIIREMAILTRFNAVTHTFFDGGSK